MPLREQATVADLAQRYEVYHSGPPHGASSAPFVRTAVRGRRKRQPKTPKRFRWSAAAARYDFARHNRCGVFFS